MLSELHDEIDEIEDLNEAAVAAVARVRERVIEIFAQLESVEDAPEAIAQLVEEELAELTTEAARKGAKAGKRRVGMMGRP